MRVLRYSVGNENNPGDPWGRSVLVIQPDGTARLDHHFSRVRAVGAWTGKVDAAALTAFWSALEQAGFPAAPTKPLLPGAAPRVLVVESDGASEQVMIGYHEAAKLPGIATQLAVAAAWSPNPKKPPLYFDMPFGDAQQEVLNKWAANAPLVFVHQYIGNLKQYKAIGMDVGDQDGLRTDAGKLHDIFDTYGIANTFEIYPGTHTSGVAVRFQNFVMPFFAKNLCSGKDCK